VKLKIGNPLQDENAMFNLVLVVIGAAALIVLASVLFGRTAGAIVLLIELVAGAGLIVSARRG